MLNRQSKLRNWVIKRVSLGYFVGLYITDAIQACNAAVEKGWSTTICSWHKMNDKAESIASNYMQALETIINENLDCYLSIKVWAIDYDFGFLKELLELAKSTKIRIHFDSLDIESADTTLELFNRAFEVHENIGYTLPACWKRSLSDAEKMIKLKVPVRIVKGQYPDSSIPKFDVKNNFLEIVNTLGGRAAHVDVATHDVHLVKKSLSILKQTNTSCNLELLYGLPLHSTKVAKSFSIPVRIYIPYGHSYIPYGLSRITNQPLIVYWMMRDILLGSKSRLINSE